MPWLEVARAVLPGGDVLTLRRRGGEFEIRCNLFELMSSRASVSERALAQVACARASRLTTLAPQHEGRRAARVLIGGLGMGFTVRAVLDTVDRDARIIVAELVPEVIEWNRGPLAELAGRPLDDGRVTVYGGDVGDVIRANPCGFDCVLMDVDNGPEAVLFPSNAGFYSVGGVRRILSALTPGGVLGVWSADRSPNFERVLASGGFAFERVDVNIRDNGPAHTIYLVQAT
jgi:spermidine synthase